MTAEETLLAVVKTQLGKQEKPIGSNWGDTIKSYLASVGINFPASWCMAFVYWCTDKFCKENNLQNPLIKTGGVLHQWEAINSKYKRKTPIDGCIFIMNFGKGLGHTGIVEWFDENFLYTIEGNTNNDGSRNGYAVERKKRSITDKKIIGYINILATNV